MDVQGELSRIEIRVATLERAMKDGRRELDRRLTSMETKLSSVHDVVTGARGGFRVFVFVASAIGATVLSVCAAIATWFHWSRP